MSAHLRFAPAARADFDEAVHFYATRTDALEIAYRFVEAVESAANAIRTSPRLWRIVEPPAVRRHVLRNFPFVIYYRFAAVENTVVIYAVAHTSREPGYWRNRLS